MEGSIQKIAEQLADRLATIKKESKKRVALFQITSNPSCPQLLTMEESKNPTLLENGKERICCDELVERILARSHEEEKLAAACERTEEQIIEEISSLKKSIMDQLDAFQEQLLSKTRQNMSCFVLVREFMNGLLKDNEHLVVGVQKAISDLASAIDSEPNSPSFISGDEAILRVKLINTQFQQILMDIDKSQSSPSYKSSPSLFSESPPKKKKTVKTVQEKAVRFSGCGQSGWRVGKGKIDAISFLASGDLVLSGVGISGATKSSVDGTIKLYETLVRNGLEQEVLLHTEDFLATSLYRQIEVNFSSKIKLKKGVVYTVAQEANKGGEMWYADAINGNETSFTDVNLPSGDIVVRFRESKKDTNKTTVYAGQIPFLNFFVEV